MARSPLEVIQITLYFVISIVGCILNGFICFVLLRRKKRRVGEYLILNLAVTDLATCALSVPFDLVERLARAFPFGSIMCYMVYPLQTILMAVSVITLLSMSLERHRLVTKARRAIVLPQTVKVAILISWVVPSLVIIPYALVLRVEGKRCLESWPEDWYVKIFTLTDFALFYAIPLAVITTSYLRAGLQVREKLNHLEGLLQGRGRSQAEYRKKREMQKVRIMKVFIFAAAAFALCMLPTHAVWIWHDFGHGWRYEHYKDVLIFSNILMYVNSALNPFIFGTLRRHATSSRVDEGVPMCFFKLRFLSSFRGLVREAAIRTDTNPPSRTPEAEINFVTSV